MDNALLDGRVVLVSGGTQGVGARIATYVRTDVASADMVRRGEPGTIVTIITTSELGGQPYLASHSTSKAGLAGLTRDAAHVFGGLD